MGGAFLKFDLMIRGVLGLVSLLEDEGCYIANSSGDKIRAEIKGKCEWGEHF